MKILGIDTSTKYLCIGICDQDKIYEFNLDVGQKLSALITLTIKRILDSLGWEAKDIDYFACGLGPGSFTSLRIGLSTIKGLAWALNKPVVGIPSLDILSRNVNFSGYTIVPIVDAKRNLMYCSAYRIMGKKLKRIMPYQLLTKEELVLKFKKDVLFFGDASGLYKDYLLKHVKLATVLERDFWYPQAHNIILVAKEMVQLKKPSNAFGVLPIYLYPKECQIKIIK